MLLIRSKTLIFTFLITAMAVSSHADDVYLVDSASSSVSFKVTQMGIAFVRGRFEDFEGTLTVDGTALTRFDGAVAIDGLTTGILARDKDLKSKSFFDAEDFPQMTFKSDQIAQENGQVTVQSYLTIRDVTKLIKFQGALKREDDQTIDMTLEGKINRKDFGLGLNKIFEFFVGNKVSIFLKLRAVREPHDIAREKDPMFLNSV